MADGYALLLSTAKYYRPSGKEIQDLGVNPDAEMFAAGDVQLDVNPEDLEEPPPGNRTPGRGNPPAQNKPAEDRQLQKAIELLKAAPAPRG
jgi:C-terminal processing protease CtpA/Prc